MVKLKNQPAFSIGKGKRPDLTNLKEKQKLPGPGSYTTIDEGLIRRHSPAFVFGTGSRESSDERPGKKPSSHSVLAGPGSYEFQTFVGNEGKMTKINPGKIKRVSEADTRNTPGPGHYETSGISALLKSMPKVKIGLAKRSHNSSLQNLQFPDPHTYTPLDQFTKT